MRGVFNWIVGTLNLSGMRMPQFSPSSIIDMLIMTFIIYKVLTFVARTRAWTLIKGVAFLTAVYFLSDIFKLYTIRFLVSNFVNVGIIALIVIFQPEIRKALENIGKSAKLVAPIGGEEDPEDIKQNAVNAIIAACRHMSKERTGALIVMENEVPLGDIEATGTKLDAVVGAGLIISIFEDKMPLHDGALIVSKNRIASAGCILPLTGREIGADLGTRHRAAVGVSEVSDASVVVVSNETGQVSIATGGKLYRNISEDEIRNMLYGVKKPPRRKLASILRGGK